MPEARSGEPVVVGPPGPDEVALIARGIRSATRPSTQSDGFQLVVLQAITRAMSGIDIDYTTLPPIEPDEMAVGLTGRDLGFRTRLVQLMELGNMVLCRPEVEVADRVLLFAEALGVDDECVHKARAVAAGSHHLAAADFDRNSYLVGLDPSVTVDGCVDAAKAWSTTTIDERVADRWRQLADLPDESLGRRVHDFYIARGFRFPGEELSAPPLLAQHDWVHVLADFGTTVECELEVFGFIARASDDPRAFALLAMVINLFQTGALPSAAGIFEADPGHLCEQGMPARLADAMRRGALCDGGVDFLAVDWFAVAEQSVEDLRAHFGVQPASPEAVAAGTVGPWAPGGISPFQVEAGRALARLQHRPYDAFGATVGQAG